MAPISPKEALENKSQVIPNEIIEIVNDFLYKRYTGGFCTIKACELREAFAKKLGYYESWWMNFEGYYAQNGWKVRFDGPGYNESFYESYYEFSAK